MDVRIILWLMVAAGLLHGQAEPELLIIKTHYVNELNGNYKFKLQQKEYDFTIKEIFGQVKTLSDGSRGEFACFEFTTAPLEAGVLVEVSVPIFHSPRAELVYASWDVERNATQVEKAKPLSRKICTRVGYRTVIEVYGRFEESKERSTRVLRLRIVKDGWVR